MSSSAKISIATSLIPNRDHELQLAAINSWTALGFAIVSVNAASEVDSIRTQFPGVTVVTANRTAEKAAGKPLPFINDMLKAAHENAPTASVVGLLNADIILRSAPNLINALTRDAADAVVMVPRVDVVHLADCATFTATGRETYSIGYDGVFMPPHMIALLPESIFCIGMPFWDYWLPLMVLLKGQPLKSIASPIALHVTHKTRWDKAIYVFFHALVSDMLNVGTDQKRTIQEPAFEIAIDVLQHTYADIFDRATGRNSQDNEANAETLASFYDRLQEVVVHHIKAKAVPLKIAEPVITAS